MRRVLQASVRSESQAVLGSLGARAGVGAVPAGICGSVWPLWTSSGASGTSGAAARAQLDTQLFQKKRLTLAQNPAGGSSLKGAQRVQLLAFRVGQREKEGTRQSSIIRTPTGTGIIRIGRGGRGREEERKKKTDKEEG